MILAYLAFQTLSIIILHVCPGVVTLLNITMVIGWIDITLCAITHEYKFTNAKHPWFNQLVNITNISYGETLHLAAMQKYKVYIFGPSITCTKYQLVIAYKTDLKTAKLSVLFQN